MSRRHQNSAQSTAVADDPTARQGTVERLIAKGKVKEAFKEAKYYFHREPSPENRRLVERTYLLRIQALIRDGMPSAGREVAQSLLEFGVKDPAMMQEVVLLLPQVGLADKALSLQGQLPSSPEAQSQLLIKLADRAVIHPEEIPASMQELRDAGGLVRSALAALDSDNEAKALELLQPIPRSSPVADWRYFVRGLAAYRKDDLEQAKINWDRLDPQRAARKIALKLLSVSDQKLADDRNGLMKTLELSVFGEPILDRLAELRRALEAADWRQVLRLVGPLRKSLYRIDPRYSQRLTDIILSPLSSEIMNRPYGDAQRMIQDFKGALTPLTWDPNWNRFEALLWEGPQGETEQAIACWRKYLNDLDRGVTGLPGELRQVQALVWRRIGFISANLADDEGGYGFDRFGDLDEDEEDEVDEETIEFRNQSIEALKQSLRLDPTQRETHELLIENFKEWDQPELMIAALEDLVKAIPDDIEALKQLIEQRRYRDEPELALGYVERLRALRPLDTSLDRDEAWCRLALARHRAWNERWEEGRAEFAPFEGRLKEQIPPYRLLARRAIFEFKAGETKRAEEFLERAKAARIEPAALSYSLVVESIRYRLPKALQQRFDKQFKSAIGGKPTSEGAGELVEMIGTYFRTRVNYAGRTDHLKDIIRYLKKTTRLAYREQDLRQVCAMLDLFGDDEKLLSQLLKRGQKLFPNSPFFPYLEVERDFNKGPMAFDAIKGRKKLEKALALAQASQDPKDAELVKVIQESIVRMQDAGKAMASLPFIPGSGGMPRSREEFKEMFEDFLDRMAGGEFEDEEPDSGRSRPAPKRKSR